MHLLLHRAGRDGHRRLDDHGSRLPVLRLRELHREHPERRRRGIRRRLRHLDDHLERPRGDQDGLLQGRDVPNGSA